jgi:Hypervirulence associated proteins TUDOR domain
MTHDFKVGDHVEWNSEAGRVRGTIKKKITSEITFKGYTVHASKEKPQYLIQVSPRENSFIGLRVTEQPDAKHLSSMRKQGEDVSNQLSAFFHAPHCMFLLFVFSDIVRRTPSANPAAEAMKSKMA